MARVRADAELVAQGFFASRDEALRAIMAGQVSMQSERVKSAGQMVKPGAFFHVKGQASYVSRGGLKLERALDAFDLDVSGLRCLDVGCSSGGFTDCLLQRGCAHVLAVDVGYAQFDWRLRGDNRVELLERTNIVDVATPERKGSIQLAVCDVSFTSVLVVLPSVVELLDPAGSFLTLIKPQFEAPREAVGEGGIVSDPAVWRDCIQRVMQGFEQAGLAPQRLCASPITGHKGNHEFLLLGTKCAPLQQIDVADVVGELS